MIAWLVLSGRWDIAGDGDPGVDFFSSLVLAGAEISAEIYWICWLLGAL